MRCEREQRRYVYFLFSTASQAQSLPTVSRYILFFNVLYTQTLQYIIFPRKFYTHRKCKTTCHHMSNLAVIVPRSILKMVANYTNSDYTFGTVPFCIV